MQIGKLALIITLTGCGSLAACSTPTEVTTRDGQTTVTKDEPEINQDTGFVTYKKGDQEVKVNKSDVKEIKTVD